MTGLLLSEQFPFLTSLKHSDTKRARPERNDAYPFGKYRVYFASIHVLLTAQEKALPSRAYPEVRYNRAPLANSVRPGTRVDPRRRPLLRPRPIPSLSPPIFLCGGSSPMTPLEGLNLA